MFALRCCKFEHVDHDDSTDKGASSISNPISEAVLRISRSVALVVFVNNSNDRADQSSDEGTIGG